MATKKKIICDVVIEAAFFLGSNKKGIHIRTFLSV
jgi:hypothetical protein